MTQEVIARTTVHVPPSGLSPEYWYGVVAVSVWEVVCPHIHFKLAEAQRCVDRLDWRKGWQRRLPL